MHLELLERAGYRFRVCLYKTVFYGIHFTTHCVFYDVYFSVRYIRFCVLHEASVSAPVEQREEGRGICFGMRGGRWSVMLVW